MRESQNQCTDGDDGRIICDGNDAYVTLKNVYIM